MIKRRIAVLLVALTATLGIGAVASSPAYAAWSDCRSGQTCFWNLHSGSGTPFQSPAAGGNLACTTLPTSVRNTASSVRNRVAGSRIWYYARTSCQEGSVLTLNDGYQQSLFIPQWQNANNNIESYRVCYFSVTNCYNHDNGPEEIVTPEDAHSVVRSSSVVTTARAAADCTGRAINLAAHPTFNPDTGNWRTATYRSSVDCGAVSVANSQWYYQIPGRTPQLVLGCGEYRVRTFWAGTDDTKVLTGWESVCTPREQVHETISERRDFRVEIRHPMESQRRSNIQPFFNLFY